MSAQEMLIEEVKRQPEPLVREVLRHLRFLERRRNHKKGAGAPPVRELAQEALDHLDDRGGEPPVTGTQWARRLRRARKLLTEKEHHELAEDIERGIELMRRRERPH